VSSSKDDVSAVALVRVLPAKSDDKKNPVAQRVVEDVSTPLNTGLSDSDSVNSTKGDSGGDDVPVSKLSMTVGQRSVMRAMLLSSRGSAHGKRKLNGIMHGTTTMTVMSGPITLGTNSGGAIQFSFGWPTFTGSADYGSMASLFEAVRVKQIIYDHEPIGEGQLYVGLTALLSGLHGPLFLSYDPNAAQGSSVSFGTLIATRPLSDSRNHLCGTGRKAHKKWNIEEKLLGISTTSTSMVGTMGSWNDTASTTPAGVIYLSANTNANNVSLSLAVGALQFVCEFAYRL